MFVGLAGGQVEEGSVINQIAAGQAKFAKGLALGQEGSDGLISDVAAGMEVDFENVGAVVGKGQDGTVI